MRRVYDDTMLNRAKERINDVLEKITFKDVSEYDYGMTRAQVLKIQKRIIAGICDEFKFGKTTHAHGIGNNNATEIIYVGNDAEEQICGLLHLNSDMFDGVYVGLTDIDNNIVWRWGTIAEHSYLHCF